VKEFINHILRPTIAHGHQTLAEVFLGQITYTTRMKLVQALFKSALSAMVRIFLFFWTLHEIIALLIILFKYNW
jgi:hypothetical protein